MRIPDTLAPAGGAALGAACAQRAHSAAFCAILCMANSFQKRLAVDIAFRGSAMRPRDCLRAAAILSIDVALGAPASEDAVLRPPERLEVEPAAALPARRNRDPERLRAAIEDGALAKPDARVDRHRLRGPLLGLRPGLPWPSTWASPLDSSWASPLALSLGKYCLLGLLMGQGPFWAYSR